MDEAKWPYWKKILFGLPGAYLSAVVNQLLIHIALLGGVELSRLFRIEYLDWYLGIRYFTFAPVEAKQLVAFSIPIVLFTAFPNLFTWFFLMICLSFTFFLPIPMGI